MRVGFSSEACTKYFAFLAARHGSGSSVSSSELSPKDSVVESDSSSEDRFGSESSVASTTTTDFNSDDLSVKIELLQLSDYYLEPELFLRTATDILRADVRNATDFVLVSLTALSVRSDLPALSAAALDRCLQFVVKEVANDVYLVCDRCNFVEHYGFPAWRAVPACRCCDSCACYAKHFSSVVAAAAGNCAHREQMIHRLCAQKRFGYGRAIHSPKLLDALTELARASGTAQPIEWLLGICEELVPLENEGFWVALNEEQVLACLETVTLGRTVSSELVRALADKEFVVAAERARNLLARQR